MRARTPLSCKWPRLHPMRSSTGTENNPVTPALKFDGSINLGNLISLGLLLLAVVGAWHALDTKITVLELQAIDAKADHATLETLKAIIGNKIPDTQGMLYSASYGSYVQVVVTSPSGAGIGTVRGYGAKGASASGGGGGGASGGGGPGDRKST